MSFHNETHTVTISGGAGSFETYHPLRGLLWQVRVRPESGDNVTGNSWVLTVNSDDGTGEVWGVDTEETTTQLTALSFQREEISLHLFLVKYRLTRT